MLDTRVCTEALLPGPARGVWSDPSPRCGCGGEPGPARV